MKRFWISLIIKEMLIKTTRYKLFTPGKDLKRLRMLRAGEGVGKGLHTRLMGCKLVNLSGGQFDISHQTELLRHWKKI